MTLRWTEEELEAWQKDPRRERWNEQEGRRYDIWDAFPKKARHKYQANPTVDPNDGIRFDSKLEARYYRRLKLRQERGDVVGFLRQVPIHLPGKTKLVVDFLEFRADGTAVFVDTKGVETEAFRLKLRQVRELYPWIEFRLVKSVRGL